MRAALPVGIVAAEFGRRGLQKVIFAPARLDLAGAQVDDPVRAGQQPRLAAGLDTKMDTKPRGPKVGIGGCG